MRDTETPVKRQTHRGNTKRQCDENSGILYRKRLSSAFPYITIVCRRRPPPVCLAFCVWLPVSVYRWVRETVLYQFSRVHFMYNYYPLFVFFLLFLFLNGKYGIKSLLCYFFFAPFDFYFALYFHADAKYSTNAIYISSFFFLFYYF